MLINWFLTVYECELWSIYGFRCLKLRSAGLLLSTFLLIPLQSFQTQFSLVFIGIHLYSWWVAFKLLSMKLIGEQARPTDCSIPYESYTWRDKVIIDRQDISSKLYIASEQIVTEAKILMKFDSKYFQHFIFQRNYELIHQKTLGQSFGGLRENRPFSRLKSTTKQIRFCW